MHDPLHNTQGFAAGGLFEVCLGVTDIVDATRYWQQFGYRLGPIADLSATDALELYNVDSAARVARMLHQEADHGLIRLFEWQDRSSDKPDPIPFRANGSRWSAAEVQRLARVFAHAKFAEGPLIVHRPDVVPAPQPDREPFCTRIGVAMEMAVSQPLYKQVLFERADFPSPLYGAVNDHCLFQASQFTHSCIMLCGVDDDCFRFYDEVLGLKRTGDFDLPHDEIGTSGKDIFQLSSEEGFHMLRFDDPRSGDGIDKRSGRLIIFNFKPDSEMVDVRSQTLLGNLGHTAYTWKVNRIHEFREKAAHLCLETGDIHLNEFGENSFTAVSPDGCQWVFISAQGGEGASE